MDVSVIIPTHNPHSLRLRRTLGGLRAQTLPLARWETLVIDNSSHPPLMASSVAVDAPANFRLVSEPQLGLTSARRRGFTESRAPLSILVDDDNVLAPDYLANVVRLFAAHPRLGAIGGKSLPEFEREPLPWKQEFMPLLALRDLGPLPAISQGLRPPGAAQDEYPVDSAPIGAGMGIRQEAARQWMDAEDGGISDRRGDELTSGGDNDIVLTIMRAGWQVGYFPELTLTHLIPASRLDPAYLGRLNHGIQQSWMQVLSKHHANPWPLIARWTVPLRQLRAWYTYRAWSSPAARIRWQGACGHFAGRAR